MFVKEKDLDLKTIRPYITAMTPEQELKELKQLLVQITNMHPPTNPENMPSGNPELVHGYKVGYANGWVHYRQLIKKLVFPSGGT